MEFTSRWTSTLILAKTMRFSLHTEEKKLALVQINQRWRKVKKTWHEHDLNGRWHLRLCRFQSVSKAVRRTELSFSLSSVCFGCWFKTIFCRFHGSSCWLEIGFCRWSLLSRSVSLWLPGFLSLIASLQATGVVLSPYQYLPLAIILFLHSHDHHASSCLVAVPVIKIISLA